MEPFKNLIDASLVAATAAHLKRAWRGFDARAFEAAAAGLAPLELKARAMHLADALDRLLPADPDRAFGVLEATLAPPVAVQGVSGHRVSPAGVAGWMLWPYGEVVVRRGLAGGGSAAATARSLAALHAFTQRFSAEFAIQPFIATRPAEVWPVLRDHFAHDASVHVRRLASEGSRPRLPWGLRLHAQVQDPTPALPLLEHLQHDTEPYVRRSVANHLNDIAKDHPALVAAWIERHSPAAGPELRSLLKHAARSLVKAGDARVLAAFGAGQRFEGRAALSIAPRRAAVGGAVVMRVVLRGTSASAQRLVLDLVVHHVKASGSTSPKVFKGWNLVLPAGGRLALERRHSLAPVTTRRYHAGRHRVELQANGQVVAEAAFVLDAP
jgi:3-methyladenine DNA glycosylase AlkC